MGGVAVPVAWRHHSPPLKSWKHYLQSPPPWRLSFWRRGCSCSGPPPPVVTVVEEPPGDNCEFGGVEGHRYAGRSSEPTPTPPPDTDPTPTPNQRRHLLQLRSQRPRLRQLLTMGVIHRRHACHNPFRSRITFVMASRRSGTGRSNGFDGRDGSDGFDGQDGSGGTGNSNTVNASARACASAGVKRMRLPARFEGVRSVTVMANGRRRCSTCTGPASAC